VAIGLWWSFRASSLEAPPYAKRRFFCVPWKTFDIKNLEPNTKTFVFGAFWSFQAQILKTSHIPNAKKIALNHELLALKICDQA
jgi:hypothetical protein